ncbi:MAG: hypothetical protein HC768_21890 [Acaryochloris sp. CRU_2_0]|nr:hypothetical protein [Acaryochloris sp. CRU_2_0]
MITTLAQISDPVGYRKSEWTRIDNPYGIKPEDFQVGMIRYNLYEVRMGDRGVGTLHYWNGEGGRYTAYFAKGQIGSYRMSQEAAAIDLITYHRQKAEASKKPIKRHRPPAYSQVTFRPDPERYRVGRAMASIT